MRLLLGTLALLLTACSDGPGSASPEEPVPTTREPATREPSSQEPAEPVGDPLTFGSSGGSVTIGCFPRGERRMVFFDSVATERPVTLSGLEPGGDALEARSTWVRRLARREVTESGVIDLRRGRTVPDRWPGARPLEGARLQPGERYSFYLLGRVRPGSRLDDVVVRWTDDQVGDSSTYSLRGRTRRGGC